MSPKAAPKRPPMGLYAFRLPDGLIVEVDRYAKRLENERSGMALTRAEAVRVLLVDALSRAMA
jgi:hypothetical protein